MAAQTLTASVRADSSSPAALFAPRLRCASALAPALALGRLRDRRRHRRAGGPRHRRSRRRPIPRPPQANIASLTDVIQPQSDRAPRPITRAASPMPASAASARRSPISRQAIKLDPNNSAAYTNRALAERQTGRNDAALADFNRAIEANPNHAPGLSRPRQSAARARPSRSGAERSRPGDPPQSRKRAGLPRARADLPEAGRQRARRHRFRQRHRPRPLRRGALSGARRKPRRRSANTTRRSRISTPRSMSTANAVAWAGLGLAYERSGNRAKAQESYQRALVLDPSQPIAKQGMHG